MTQVIILVRLTLKQIMPINDQQRVCVTPDMESNPFIFLDFNSRNSTNKDQQPQFIFLKHLFVKPRRLESELLEEPFVLARLVP